VNVTELQTELVNLWENRRSDLNTAAARGRELLGICEVHQFVQGIAHSHKILGYCFWRFSDFSKSLDHSLKALSLFREIKDLRGEADALNNLGAVYMFHKNHEKRLECNLKCLEIRKELGNADDISGSMNNIGETYFEMGNWAEAEEWFYACIHYPGATDDSIAWGYHNLGKVHVQRNETEQAARMFGESMHLSERIAYHVLSTETLLELSRLHLRLQQPSEAKDYAKRAYVLSEEIGAKDEYKAACALLAEIAERSGHFSEALHYFKKYHQLHTEIFNDSNLQRIKDLEHQHELDNIRKEQEIERLKTVELRGAYDEIERQKMLVEERNKDIIDSIRYARSIQQALLKEKEHVSPHLPEHFILFQPRDIVSGDFYWAHEKNGILYLAVADCTGHGVPGGFLTMLGIAFLNEIIASNENPTPAEILNQLSTKFKHELQQNSHTADSLDISLLSLDVTDQSSLKSVHWAGAYTPIWIAQPEMGTQLLEIAPDKFAIGSNAHAGEYTNHILQLPAQSMIYLFTDGFADQFGGERGKKMKKERFKREITHIHQLSTQNQVDYLSDFFSRWKGAHDQVDDVCVVGIRV
jgi:serine phosphatase RsbU (regulator of sigma subunit)